MHNELWIALIVIGIVTLAALCCTSYYRELKKRWYEHDREIRSLILRMDKTVTIKEHIDDISVLVNEQNSMKDQISVIERNTIAVSRAAQQGMLGTST